MRLTKDMRRVLDAMIESEPNVQGRWYTTEYIGQRAKIESYDKAKEIIKRERIIALPKKELPNDDVFSTSR